MDPAYRAEIERHQKLSGSYYLRDLLAALPKIDTTANGYCCTQKVHPCPVCGRSNLDGR